jgi:hypothetical protein
MDPPDIPLHIASPHSATDSAAAGSSSESLSTAIPDLIRPFALTVRATAPTLVEATFIVPPRTDANQGGVSDARSRWANRKHRRIGTR